MQYLFMILFILSATTGFASCYKLEAEDGTASIDKVCLTTTGEVLFYERENIEYSFQAAVNYIPEHTVYQQGLDEGHEIHVDAAYEFTGSTDRAEIDATISVVANPPGINNGCWGHTEFDHVNYCFTQNNPISNLEQTHMCSINADLPCHFGEGNGDN